MNHLNRQTSVQASVQTTVFKKSSAAAALLSLWFVLVPGLFSGLLSVLLSVLVPVLVFSRDALAYPQPPALGPGDVSASSAVCAAPWDELSPTTDESAVSPGAVPQEPQVHPPMATPIIPTVTTPSLPAPPPAAWQRAFTCDHDQVWINVDLNDRRHIQLISRNLTANRYILNLAIIPTTFEQDYSQLTFLLAQEKGIYQISDFAIPSSQQGISFTNPIRIGDDYMTRFSVVTRTFLDANGGLRVEFVRTDMQICTFYDNNTQSCSGDRTYNVRDRYIGNWYFTGCR